ALDRLLEHHDALRLRYVSTGGDWQQSSAAPGEQWPIELVDLAGKPAVEQTAAIESRAARAQSELDLADGPIVRAILFDLGGGLGSRLLIVIHHLAIDAVSWGVLLA